LLKIMDKTVDDEDDEEELEESMNELQIST
jgi:hypothetical protein